VEQKKGCCIKKKIGNTFEGIRENRGEESRHGYKLTRRVTEAGRNQEKTLLEVG